MTLREALSVTPDQLNTMSRSDLAKVTRVLADVARKRFNRMEDSEFITREHTQLKRKLAAKGRVELALVDGEYEITKKNSALFRTVGNQGQLKSEYIMLKQYLGGSTQQAAKDQFNAMMSNLGLSRSYRYDPKTKSFIHTTTGVIYTRSQLLAKQKLVTTAIERLYAVRPDLYFSVPPSKTVAAIDSWVVSTGTTDINKIMDKIEEYVSRQEQITREMEEEAMARFEGKGYIF